MRYNGKKALVWRCWDVFGIYINSNPDFVNKKCCNLEQITFLPGFSISSFVK